MARVLVRCCLTATVILGAAPACGSDARLARPRVEPVVNADNQASARRFIDSDWDTLARIGGKASDTTLLRPRLIAAGQGRLAAFDYGDYQIKVFDGSGAMLWRFGQEGSGPGEFRGAFDIEIAQDTSVWLLDPRLNRITVVSRTGEFVDVLDPNSELLSSMVPRPDGVIAVTARLDPFWLYLDRNGMLLRQGAMPVSALADVPAFARQPLVSSTPDVWAVVFPYGNLLIVYRGEHLHCTGTLIEGEGFPAAPAPDLTFWAAAIAVRNNNAVVLAQGKSEHRLRALDFYALDDCSYAHSLLLPRPASALAHAEGVFWIEYEDPAPALLGLRLKAGGSANDHR